MSFIFEGDCLEEMKKVEDNYVDMVLVDLPYGQTSCHWDIKINLEAMWSELERVSKPNCNFVFFTTTRFGNELINSKPKWFRYDIVWEKNMSVGFLQAKKAPLRAHEMIYVFGKPGAKNKVYNPQMTAGKPYSVKRGHLPENSVYGKHTRSDSANLTGERYPRSVHKCCQEIFKKTYHRTQKPVSLCEWLIKTYSNENDVVMDFCMGGGSSIIACINTNRKCIGIEKDNEIYNTAKARIIEHITATLATPQSLKT